MKPVSNDFLLAVVSQAQMAIAELYTITLLNGTNYYYTDLDLSLVIGGHTYVANSLRFEGLKFKLAIGFQVDEQELRIDAYPTDDIGSDPVFGALQEGLLDGAYIKRSRAFWKTQSGPAYLTYATTPLQVVDIFTGRVSTITKIGRTHVEMKIKSPLVLLDIDMPRNTYEASCQWVLYDAGCTLNRASFTNLFTVQSASSQVITPVGGVSSPTGADGLPNYLQGRLLFTSGVNDNFQTLIANNDATNFYLQYPLVNVPAPGDTFSASIGCSKQTSACTNKFSNLANFRGFPRVPPVYISV